MERDSVSANIVQDIEVFLDRNLISKRLNS
jgi:hypothetical protein